MPEVPPRARARLQRGLRRSLLVAAALAIVGLSATACLPPAAPAAPPLAPAAPAPLVPEGTPQATIAHCPVEGFAFNQGFSSTHSGVDLAAPEGTPVYAVRSGTLWYWSTGDVGGYSLYLKADDGNTYYYTHLTAYGSTLENTTSPVEAGDVIETVNHTGNANGFNHLHFELRLGGPNGTRVDPKPTLD